MDSLFLPQDALYMLDGVECFNPYFNGFTILTNEAEDVPILEVAVSILILMDSLFLRAANVKYGNEKVAFQSLF